MCVCVHHDCGRSDHAQWKPHSHCRIVPRLLRTTTTTVRPPEAIQCCQAISWSIVHSIREVTQRTFTAAAVWSELLLGAIALDVLAHNVRVGCTLLGHVDNPFALQMISLCTLSALDMPVVRRVAQKWLLGDCTGPNWPTFTNRIERSSQWKWIRFVFY